MVEDEQLLQSIAESADNRERNEKTSELISRYIRIIRIKANKMHSNTVEADDLVSEGFIGLLSAIRNYSPEKGKFSAFANTCINNRMKTAVMKSDNRLVLTEDFDFDEIEDDNVSTEDLVIRKEQNSEISEKLDKLLSKREKEVLSLYIGACSYEEIAAKLNISVKSVDNALSRARKKLRAGFSC